MTEDSSPLLAAGVADPEDYAEGAAITVTYHGSLTNENAELEEIEEVQQEE